MVEPPTGEVTLVFTDIEGSSAMWDALGDDFRASIALHDEILRAATPEFGAGAAVAGRAYFEEAAEIAQSSNVSDLSALGTALARLRARYRAAPSHPGE